MTKTVFLFITMVFVMGCASLTPTTENPTDPRADDPLILGEEVVPPIGCLEWQVREGIENADC